MPPKCEVCKNPPLTKEIKIAKHKLKKQTTKNSAFLIKKSKKTER